MINRKPKPVESVELDRLLFPMTLDLQNFTLRELRAIYKELHALFRSDK